MSPVPLALLFLIGCLAAATPSERAARVEKVNQSGLSSKSIQPVAGAGAVVETPELVLAVKYREGEVDGVVLTKFRRDRTLWEPSLSDQTRCCKDLCTSGLGGSTCGSSCMNWIPDALLELVNTKGRQAHQHLNITRELASEEEVEKPAQLGAPRASVCPTLCANGLGQPLCDCAVVQQQENFTPSWRNICAAFCFEDQYVLAGCPPCAESFAQDRSAEDQYMSQLSTNLQARILNTAEGWILWCTGQCRIGEGGAACNCDRAPFF